MKRYIAVLEIEDDVKIVGDIETVANYTYRDNGTNYAYTESVEFKQEISDANMKMWEEIYAEEERRTTESENDNY